MIYIVYNIMMYFQLDIIYIYYKLKHYFIYTMYVCIIIIKSIFFIVI